MSIVFRAFPILQLKLEAHFNGGYSSDVDIVNMAPWQH